MLCPACCSTTAYFIMSLSESPIICVPCLQPEKNARSQKHVQGFCLISVGASPTTRVRFTETFSGMRILMLKQFWHVSESKNIKNHAVNHLNQVGDGASTLHLKTKKDELAVIGNAKYQSAPYELQVPKTQRGEIRGQWKRSIWCDQQRIAILAETRVARIWHGHADTQNSDTVRHGTYWRDRYWHAMTRNI